MNLRAVHEESKVVTVPGGRVAGVPVYAKRAARALAAIILLLSFGVVTTACNDVDDLVDLGPVVTGAVTDASNNQAIAAVTVSVGGRQGMTNPNGTFYIAQVNRGTQVITATKEGYVRYSGEVTVGNGELTDVKINMVRQ